MKHLFILLASLCVAATTFAQKANVVILSGANNHDWASTTPVLEKIMVASGRFNVAVITEPEKLISGLADCDVLLSNWNAFGKPKPAPWTEELKAAYVDFVRNGGGHRVLFLLRLGRLPSHLLCYLEERNRTQETA
jgi:hypothetical protein